MSNTFIVDGVEYKMVRNPSTNGPMIARVDSLPIENRKEICRRFLRMHGWTNFPNKINTNQLERAINNIVNGGALSNEIGKVEKAPKPIKEKKPRKQRAYPRKEGVPDPSIEQVEYWLNKWDTLEDYVAQEEAINEVFLGKYNSNDNLQNILIKSSILNDFYSTNIFKIYPVAKHIFSLKIDKRLKEGDPTLVNDISKNFINDEEKNFYSFASKYCSHHNPLNYPIYDSYVHKVLMYFKRVDNFFDYEEEDLKDYPKFKEILIKFREFYNLGQYNLKELDKYLWQFGKKYFPKSYKKERT